MTTLKMCKETSDLNGTLDTDGWICTSKIKRLKCAKIAAKLGIASGLLALFASVAIYGLEEKIHEVSDQDAAENQESYRLKEIDEYTYHTRLKQTTLQRLCRI